MTLNEPLIIRLPDTSRTPPIIRSLPPITEVVVELVMDDFTHKTVTASIKGFPFVVKLWGKADYDTALWTNESAQARLDELVPNLSALKALIPEPLKQYNS